MIELNFFQLLCVANFLCFGLQQQTEDTTPLKLQYRPQSEAYLVENSLQPSEQDVPLEDFFWTGSGEGPLYLKPKDHSSGGSKYPTIVRTATILATVFIDGNFDEFDPLCVYDCDKKGDGSGIVESIDRIPPSDRRYWLLTVVAGLFSTQDFPILEEKLAKLYRIAFLRQQAKHLGIVNGNATTVLNQTNMEESVTRKKRFAIEISPTKTLNASEEIRTRRFEINKHVYERQVIRMKRQRVPVKREVPPSKPPITLKLPAPYEIIYKSDDKSKSKKLKSNQNFMQKVSVMIHRVAHDEEEGSDTNKLENNLTNQTEIIYSVIVGGKPVLATTAAEDMRLVSTDEVIKIIENDVVLKAEPYLREPMATPLVPPSKRDGEDMDASIAQNPLLISLSILALILFILLLLTLLLYGRSKRRFAAEAKRQSATQALVHKIDVDDDINMIRSNSLDEIGVENLAFEKENRERMKLQRKEPPILSFPLPPATRPSSSTSTTSDSSVYYPKRRYKFSSIQDLLEDREGNADEIYTKLKSSAANKVSAKKKDASKVHKHRHRRKHRVGSVEQINSDADIVYNDESLMHNEALNPNVSHYNANKLMTDKSFSVIESERKRSGKSKVKKSSGGGHVEAINQELLLQQKGRIASADTNSIGSFLSMASIRSFPKCSVTEPLNRILEPVSVTHLDHSDADYETLKNYRMMDSQKSLDMDDSEREARTQSDGADPGVLGPIVWEMHKKNLDISTKSLGSPLRDPHASRNRFEGLLDGAMKLYSSSSYSNCHSSMKNNHDDDQLGQMPGVIKSKEARGKSAATIRLTSRTSGLLSRTDFHPARPKTADQPDIQPHNPLPTIHAWSGSGNNLRPMSAGIYHKPDVTSSEERLKMDRHRAMSASPIIDAIQEELRRISNEK